MSTEQVTGAWHPKTGGDRDLVRSQLDKIVSDGRFAASKRYPQLLRYIVEQTLAQNEDDLKERTLGVEVFHRPPDYDTNLDPVVRLCAAEVRKRLAQYYQSPEHGDELRIELNPGSYIPVFVPPAPHVPALEVNPADVPINANVPSSAEHVRQKRTSRKTYWVAGLIASATIIAVLLILAVRYWKPFEKPKSALDEVWSPLLTSSKPILFCVGTSKVTTLPGSQLAELQSGADEDSFHQALVDMNDFVPFSDVQILSRFSSLVQAHAHAFRIQSFQTTVSSQLREGPVVLIGALNNDNWLYGEQTSLPMWRAQPPGMPPAYSLLGRGQTAP
jgi:hypothetical protein